MDDVAPVARHYGIDWLRIGAFGLLIIYHVAMVFAPWPWVVKWPETFPSLIVPMALLTPWRIPLLFVVAGFATRRLIARMPSLGAFAHQRSLRLLVPLAFAMLVLLPPELWVRARLAGDADNLARFWLSDYWRPWAQNGRGFPQWEHMWFVVYLWAYTMVLALLLARVGAGRIQAWFEWLAAGRRIIWAPMLALAGAKVALMFVVPETQGLTTDWSGHAGYLPLFLFGFALGGSPALWRAVRQHWVGALVIAGLCSLVVVGVELHYQGLDVPGHALMAANRAARRAMAWGVIIALLRLADGMLNRDHPLRRPLAEAVFPAYLIHHPVLVVLAWVIPSWGMSAGEGFVFLLSVTAAACVACYVIGRDIPWLRPLIGLAPATARPARRLA